jgi:transcriptional regulator with XRE-family HTH domain
MEKERLVTTFEKLWPKFKRSKRYREAFVAQHAKEEIGFQIRALMKQHDLTQTLLAKRAGLTQGVVSRAADPSYGNLTINTLVRIAAGLDVAFVGRFVPFSELPNWFDRIYEEPFRVPSFEQENRALEEQSAAAAARWQSNAETESIWQQMNERTLSAQYANITETAPLLLVVTQEDEARKSSSEAVARQQAVLSNDNVVDLNRYRQRMTESPSGSPSNAIQQVASAQAYVGARALRLRN